MTPEQRVQAVKEKYGADHWWEATDARVLALGQLRERILIVPFPTFHEAVEKAIGRPVWTHEFADPQRLIDEIEGLRPASTFADVLDQLPADKAIVVVTDAETPTSNLWVSKEGARGMAPREPPPQGEGESIGTRAFVNRRIAALEKELGVKLIRADEAQERISALERERDDWRDLANQGIALTERLEAHNARLRRHLELAITRLGICRNRFEGCEDQHPDTHRVSLLEVPAWIDEHRAALTTDPLGGQAVGDEGSKS